MAPNSATLRVVAYPTEGPAVVREVKNDLPDLQELVGGYIELVRFSAERTALRLVVNEEGLMNRLPLNVKASAILGAPVVGPAFVLRTAGSGFTSLTDADLSALGVTP